MSEAIKAAQEAIDRSAKIVEEMVAMIGRAPSVTDTKLLSYLQQENSVLLERVRRLEIETKDLERMLAAERQDKWNWERKAKERWALRKELEEAIGLADRETYDEEKFKAAVKRIGGLNAALAAEREACAKVAEEYGLQVDLSSIDEKDDMLNLGKVSAAENIAALIRGRDAG